MHKEKYPLIACLLLIVLIAAACNRPIPGSSSPSATSIASTIEPLSLTRTSLSGQIMATLTAAGGSPFPPAQLTSDVPPEIPTQIQATSSATLTPPASPASPATATPTPTVIPPAITSSPTSVQSAAPVSKAPQQISAPPAVYRLHKGEFPWCLARRFNVNPRQLLRINGFYIGQIFYPGQPVYFPSNPKPFPGQRMLHHHPASYKVKWGDTIYSIACFYGDLDPIYLAQFNGINPPYRLKVGEILSIP